MSGISHQALLVSYGVPPTLTFASNAVSATDLTTYTFSSQSIGAAAYRRYVVVGVFIAFSTTRTITSVTVGGNAASLIGVAGSSTNTALALYGLQIDAGATANIVVTASGTCLNAGVGVWALYDLLGFTPVDTGNSSANPGTDTLTTSDGGIALAIASNGQALSTYTWSGLSENFDATVEAATSTSYSGASSLITTGSALGITATRSNGSSAQGLLVTASFR